MPRSQFLLCLWPLFLGVGSVIAQNSGCGLNGCLNGGACEQQLNSNDFICQCPSGFQGSQCERNITVAASTPCNDLTCLNGGVCLSDNNDGLYCKCNQDPTLGKTYRGQTCQDQTNECGNGVYCYHGGSCANKNTTCSCPFGFDGANCQSPVAICSYPVVCFNGGTCSKTQNGTSVCNCPDGYTGAYCNTAILAGTPVRAANPTPSNVPSTAAGGPTSSPATHSDGGGGLSGVVIGIIVVVVILVALLVMALGYLVFRERRGNPYFTRFDDEVRGVEAEKAAQMSGLDSGFRH